MRRTSAAAWSQPVCNSSGCVRSPTVTLCHCTPNNSTLPTAQSHRPTACRLCTCCTVQVLPQSPKLTAFLQVPAASATPESLFVALRLWHNIPQQQLHRCQLLPALPAAASPPAELFWQQPGVVQRSSVAAAAAAVFAAGHVKALCPALLATTASHPRLHPVWGCMLALLVPGFVPVKVRGVFGLQLPGSDSMSSMWLHTLVYMHPHGQSYTHPHRQREESMEGNACCTVTV